MESCCQHKGSKGNSGWKHDGGRNSLLSTAAFLNSQSLGFVLQLKITQACNKDITNDVTGITEKEQNIVGDAVSLKKSLSMLLGDSGDVCKLTGAITTFLAR